MFEGPFFEFDSAEAYMESLKTDPPEKVKYHLLESYEKDGSACLVYLFSKPGVQTPMVQIFHTAGDKIKKIQLMFDTGAFTEKPRKKGPANSGGAAEKNEVSKQGNCPFCSAAEGNHVIERNSHAYAIPDKYPVTEGHTLIIPNRHFSDFFEIEKPEQDAVFDLIRVMRMRLLIHDAQIAGFNIGINTGRAAGQTIPHCHVHLIPRRRGDVGEPRGGIRGAIPEKRIY
jgi:diadenosine tetraphosphate (Ap4A) HIT family hydrolase